DPNPVLTCLPALPRQRVRIGRNQQVELLRDAVRDHEPGLRGQLLRDRTRDRLASNPRLHLAGEAHALAAQILNGSKLGTETAELAARLREQTIEHTGAEAQAACVDLAIR